MAKVLCDLRAVKNNLTSQCNTADHSHRYRPKCSLNVTTCMEKWWDTIEGVGGVMGLSWTNPVNMTGCVELNLLPYLEGRSCPDSIPINSTMTCPDSKPTNSAMTCEVHVS